MIICYRRTKSFLLKCAIIILISLSAVCAYSEQAHSLSVEAGKDTRSDEKADTEQVFEEIWFECAPESSFSVDSVVSPQDNDVNWEPIDKSKAKQYGNTGFWYIGDSNMQYCFYIGGVRDSAHRVILDDKGVAIVRYTGLSSNVTVPSKIAGCDVVFVDLSDCSTSVGSLDVSSCSKLGLLKCPSSPVSPLVSLDVTSLPQLKYLSCENQELRFLNISKNRKLVTLHCANNYLSNQDALSRWLSAGGHYGRIAPQKARSYDSSLSATPMGSILVSGLSNMSLPIPLTASDGTALPFVGGFTTTLNLLPVPMKTSVYSDGSFRIAFGTLVPPDEMGAGVWDDFKGYVKNGTGFSAAGLAGVCGTDNFTISQDVVPGVLGVSGNLRGFVEGLIVDGDPVVTLSGVRMEVLRTLQFGRDFFTPTTPPIPVTLMFDYGIGLNASFRLSYNPVSGNLSLDGGNASVLFPYLCVTGGVGNSEAVYIGAYGSLSNYFYIPASGSL